MNWLNQYKALKNKNVYTKGRYSLVPIRFDDRYQIMNWRNDQMFHLRQSIRLTKENQDLYFTDTISKTFRQEKPSQILFSFLENNILVGYGGLVHIQWKKKEAEISFLTETKNQNKKFKAFWGIFLDLIEDVAFSNLNLIRIFTCSYNLRPKLYEVLEKKNYREESREKISLPNFQHDVDMIYNAKYSDSFHVRRVNKNDVDLIFDWVNEKTARENSIISDYITYKDHKKWFTEALKKSNLDFLLAIQKIPVGSIRVEKNQNDLISFLVAKEHQKKKIGSKIISYVTNNYKSNNLEAYVLNDNIPSKKIFKNFDFKIESTIKKNGKSFLKFLKKIY